MEMLIWEETMMVQVLKVPPRQGLELFADRLGSKLKKKYPGHEPGCFI
jgi:hypothetical protein